MKYDEFKKAVDRIIEDEDTLMIHVSPDFQCDQTLGFPTSLCVCWEQGKAWLARLVPSFFVYGAVGTS